MKRRLDVNAFLGISATECSYACIATLVSYVTLLHIQKIVMSRLAALSARTSTRFDDMVVTISEGTHRFTLLVPAILIGSSVCLCPSDGKCAPITCGSRSWVFNWPCGSTAGSRSGLSSGYRRLAL